MFSSSISLLKDTFMILGLSLCGDSGDRRSRMIEVGWILPTPMREHSLSHSSESCLFLEANRDPVASGTFVQTRLSAILLGFGFICFPKGRFSFNLWFLFELPAWSRCNLVERVTDMVMLLVVVELGSCQMLSIVCAGVRGDMLQLDPLGEIVSLLFWWILSCTSEQSCCIWVSNLDSCSSVIFSLLEWWSGVLIMQTRYW